MARTTRKFKLKINEDEWTYRKLSDNKYEEEYGLDSSAITNITDKHIDFKASQLNFKVVVHEFNHVYMSYLHLNSARDALNLEAIEEIMCEYLEDKITKITEKSCLAFSNLDNETYIKKGYYRLHQALLDLE